MPDKKRLTILGSTGSIGTQTLDIVRHNPKPFSVAGLAANSDPALLLQLRLDYADGMQPYFSVPATGIENLDEPIREWPFNDPEYTVFPVLNLAVGGSGGGDPTEGSYPQEMLVDWVRVF